VFHALQLWFSYPPMAQKRILIGTPLKGDIPKSYFRTSLQMATAQVPDVKLDWILLDGPAVQIARNEIAHYAVEQKFDELIFWDKDVLAMRNGEDVTAAALMRLISHDRDIVTAVYSSRSLNTHWHVHPIKGEEPDEAGLQRVERASIGFSKIKVPVFKKIALANIDRAAMLVDPNKAPKLVPELFPMELRGRNTSQYRLQQIWAALSEVKNDEVLRARIERELTIRYDEPNSYISEDFGFCDLARAAGYDIWMDTLMVLGHQASVTVPIESGKLLEMLSEPWRKEELAIIKQQMLEAQAAKKK
jgi:hypothetical protein